MLQHVTKRVCAAGRWMAPMSENLNHWTFVVASYVLGIAGTGLLVAQSWLAMLRAEARRERSREQ